MVVHTFPKENVIIWLEFKLTYNHSAAVEYAKCISAEG